MKLVYEPLRARFECITAYGEGDAPKAAGMRWERTIQRWHTTDANAANRLREHADPDTCAKLDAAMVAGGVAAEAAAAVLAVEVAASRATDSNIEVPAPEGLSYLGYQRAGIAYAAARKDTLIADEPGLGKTIQALGVANTMLSDARPVVRMLVIAPKIALWNWRKESEKWLVRPHRIAIWAAKAQPDADVVIINYDVLARPAVAAALRAETWDIAVFDEAHALKTGKAARTKACLGFKKDGIAAIPATRRLFLTGTPILNRPVELFPVLHAMQVPEASSFFDFAKRYCEGRNTSYGFDASGASNLAELQELLRRRVMVRRLKADVLSDLAPKRYGVVELEADTPALRKALAAESAAEMAAAAGKKAAKDRVAAARRCGDALALKQAIAALADCGRVEFAEMSRVRHETALAKVPQVVEHVVEYLVGSEESVLVMAHHQDVIAGIVAGLAAAGHGAAVITGDTGDIARQQAQEDIQSRRERVFVGSMRACGVAITLTAASTVVFAEQDWGPSVMRQAEDRAHRIGQEGSVLVQYLVVDGSFDARMAKVVAQKEGIIEDALDGATDPAEAVTVTGTAAVETEVVAPQVVAAGTGNVAAEMVAQEDTAPLLATPDPIPVEVVPAPVSVAIAVEPTAPEDAPVSAGAEVTATKFVSTDHPASPTVDASATVPADIAPRRRRGRPPLGDAALSAADRTRRWRQQRGIRSVGMPAGIAERIARLRVSRGAQVDAALLTALDALEASS